MAQAKERAFMAKHYRNSKRRDSTTDHSHSLPDGKLTGGLLMKPSPTQWGWHTHLYEIDGQVCETTQAHDLPGHVHETVIGETSGPQPVRKVG